MYGMFVNGLKSDRLRIYEMFSNACGLALAQARDSTSAADKAPLRLLQPQLAKAMSRIAREHPKKFVVCLREVTANFPEFVDEKALPRILPLLDSFAKQPKLLAAVLEILVSRAMALDADTVFAAVSGRFRAILLSKDSDVQHTALELLVRLLPKLSVQQVSV